MTQTERQQILEIRIGKVHIRPDDIYEIELKPNEMMTLADAHEIRQAKMQLTGGKECPNLFLMGTFGIPDHQVRAYASTEESKAYRTADAIVIHSFAQKMVANFYMSFHKPPVPTRFFQTKAAAVEWLLQLRDIR
jgi:hypothetical protein